ncbi:hypothetical protein EIP91_000096 [Steccherinum ochraceum]|uniref:Protein kinase domain-containing protein n=1 Tax=Steccherinum ochraceum TaxID=92696 RepID=A0A4R0S4G9_9APHY|nr:hypothetical protein EIP91_000096 [Steccherinum ochraceum]
MDPPDLTPNVLYRGLVRSALSSSPDSGAAQDALIQLAKDEAQEALDLVWESLKPSNHSGSSDIPARNQVLQLATKLNLKHKILPSSFFIGDVVLSSTEPVGEGAFAHVYRGTYNGVEVAVKKIRAPSAEQGLTADDATCREALLWKDIEHPHILPLIGVTRTAFSSGALCLVSPWMPQGNVRATLSSHGDQPAVTTESVGEIIDEWLYQIAQGLEYLHSQGVVHGDLHGANVLLDDRDRMRLSDFGLSLIANAPSYEHGSLHGGGAVCWRAPELIDPDGFQQSGRRPTFASDVWSFGMLCIEFYLGGKPPYSESWSAYQI